MISSIKSAVWWVLVLFVAGPIHAEQITAFSIRLDGVELINEYDVISYDWNGHVVRITDAASDAISKVYSGGRSTPESFEVWIGSEALYSGHVYPCYTSSSSPSRGPLLCWDMPRQLELRITYCGEESEDPRSSVRLYVVLSGLGILSE